MKSYIIIYKREREIEEKFFNFERDIKQDFIRKRKENRVPDVELLVVGQIITRPRYKLLSPSTNIQ